MKHNNDDPHCIKFRCICSDILYSNSKCTANLSPINTLTFNPNNVHNSEQDSIKKK